MIVQLKPGVEDAQLTRFVAWLEGLHIKVEAMVGEKRTVLGLIGDTSVVDMDIIKAMQIVEDVKRIQEPYKNSNRKFHPHNTVVQIGGVKIGDGHFATIAGPCSVEGEEQIVQVAKDVQKAGAQILRGGAFKPRTSPYSFQGLGEEGIRLLLLAKKETGLPIVTEIMDLAKLNLFDEVDMIQVGARNMQNYELLKELGKIDKPILLKRGLSATLEELLMSAEYILSGGNPNVILCERGIRTFETYTRNTLDLSAVPVLQKLSHLPVLVDPSHGTGSATLVPAMALAATAAGADGLMIEVHNDPEHALSDGPQAMRPDDFATLMKQVNSVKQALQG